MKPKRKKGKKKIVGKPHLLCQVEVDQKKYIYSNNKKKMWAILSKYFCPIFTLIFSPIWRDCVLEGEEWKLVDPTKISPLFHPQPNNHKHHFLSTFLSIIFHPLYKYSNQTKPKINQELQLMRLSQNISLTMQKASQPFYSKKANLTTTISLTL